MNIPLEQVPLIFTVVALSWYIKQQYISSLINKWNEDIQNAAESLYKNIPTKKPAGFSKEKWQKKIKEESIPMALFVGTKKYLRHITGYVANLEFFLFLALTVTVFVLANGHKQIAPAIFFPAVSWLGIKTFANTRYWAFEVFGRATFYVYFIGSFWNIAIAVITGYLIHLWFLS
jgi:hypothetical protein